MKSEEVGVPVDPEGEPLPWYTYPAIDFLEPRIKSDFRVFEYGSGNSSLWYSDRAGEVVSIEDSEDWAREMEDRAPSNLEMIFQPAVEHYPNEIADQGMFDIVVIDGSVRTDCLKPARDALNEQGVIILDDFERWEREDWEVLKKDGFHYLPFFGPKSQRLTESCTAILYREENCLNI